MAYKLTYVAGNAPLSEVRLPADAYGDGVQQPVTIFESYCSQTYDLNIKVYLDELQENLIQTIPFDMDVSLSAYSYTDQNGQTYTSGEEVGLTSNVTLTPEWGDNYSLDTKSVDLSGLTVPNRPGYTFSGWDVLSGEQIVNNKLILESNPINTEDRVIFATWAPNLITVQIEYAFQSLEDPNTYIGNPDLTITISGYANEYYYDIPVQNVYGFISPEQESIYLGDYAETSQPLYVYHYERRQYTLTILQTDGLSITAEYGDKTINNASSITAPYETEVRLIPVALEGYKFLGWSSTQNEEDIITPGELTYKLVGNSSTYYPICKKIISPEPGGPNINVKIDNELKENKGCLIAIGKSWKNILKVYVLKDSQWKTK